MNDLTTQIIKRAAADLRDPDKVVRDPENLYEEAGARACLIGSIGRAADAFTSDTFDAMAAESDVYDAVRDRHGPRFDYTNYLRDHGGAGCADLLEGLL